MHAAKSCLHHRGNFSESWTISLLTQEQRLRRTLLRNSASWNCYPRNVRSLGFQRGMYLIRRKFPNTKVEPRRCRCDLIMTVFVAFVKGQTFWWSYFHLNFMWEEEWQLFFSTEFKDLKVGLLSSGDLCWQHCMVDFGFLGRVVKYFRAHYSFVPEHDGGAVAANSGSSWKVLSHVLCAFPDGRIFSEDGCICTTKD